MFYKYVIYIIHIIVTDSMGTVTEEKWSNIGRKCSLKHYNKLYKWMTTIVDWLINNINYWGHQGVSYF